jgi:hypothetical protein
MDGIIPTEFTKFSSTFHNNSHEENSLDGGIQPKTSLRHIIQGRVSKQVANEYKHKICDIRTWNFLT